MSDLKIPRARIEQLCRDLCDRCAQGHFPWLDESGRYSHGTDESGEGSDVWIPPELCAAEQVRKMMAEIEGEAIHCEHGIADGEYCEACSKEYKRAAREAGYES